MKKADVDAEGLNSDFDLNSLIEGDVDDDDFGEEFVTALEEPRVDKKDGPVRVHFEPLKDLEGSVDEVLSEEELESLAVNVGSLNNQRNNGNSDTEGDFLDKSFDEKKSVLARANKQLEEDNEYKENMADDENSVCGSDMDRVRDKKSVKVERGRSSAPGQDSDSDSGGPKKASKSNNNISGLPKLPDTEPTTETSDFDSVSTTSASYVVSHSDMESLSLDDHQLDLLMNKSDLSDLDQLDAKTITGSGSSDEECPAGEVGGSAGSVESVLNLTTETTGGKLLCPEVGQEQRDPGRTDQEGCEGQDPSCGGGEVVEEAAQVVAGAPCQDNPPSGPPVAGGRTEGAECGRAAAQTGGKQQYVRTAPSTHAQPPSLPFSPNPASLSAKKSLVDPVDTVRSCPRAELGKSKAGGVGLSDFDRQGTPDVPRRKGSVSELIAKFSASGSRSNTPERSITPDSRSLRSATPDKSGKSAEDSDGSHKIVSSISKEKEKEKQEGNATGARPKQPRQQQQPSASQANEGLQETLGSAVSHGEIPTTTTNESERAELRGLKEFTQKYLKEQAAKNASSKKKTEPEQEPAHSDSLGCEGGAEGVDSDIEDIDMPPTIRRNSGGAYTSYVFISNEPSNDEVASVVSSSGSYTDPENRVTVNVKETTVSPNTCVVAIQDGRTSNISIVSTESSELNSPRQSPTSLDEPPELPTKVKVGVGKDHNELQQIVYATRESLRDFSHRSRGGEQDIPRDFMGEDEEDVDHDRGGLANYFTSTLESSSFISRRGRPPVIRAAEKVRRQQGSGFEYEDESRGMMIDYSDHQPYRESSSTPVLDVDSEMVEGYEGRDKFKITEVPTDDYSPAHSDVVYDEYDPQVQYDIHYGSGESGDEYIEQEDYPRCQQVYDSEEYSYSEGEQISSGDEFDREEELRGYNRAIDFTLHTIIEESCEDSEPENRSLRAGNRKRHSDPSELEKYFFYGVGGGNMDQSMQEESEYSDTNSESYADGQQKETSVDSADLASTRLEKYFLTGFEEEQQLHSLDVISEGGNTDDSGSVGSESDGTGEVVPEPPRKKVTQRTRGFRSERLSDRGESGAENVEDESGTYMARPHDVSYSSESGEDNTAFVSGDGSFDTIKRKKNKARKASDDRRSDSERSVDSRRSSAVSEVPFFKPADTSNDTAGGTETVTVNKKDDKSSPKASPSITPTPLNDAHQSDPAAVKKHISPSGSDKEPESTKPRGSGSSRESPSTSPPPAGGPVRKHKSRDSGFVGSNDDLLRNEGSHIIHTSSDDMQSNKHTGSSSDGEQESRKITRLEKVSEVSENTEDDCEKSFDAKVTVASPKESSSVAANKSARKKSNESDVSKEGSSEGGKLSRKDSFHQWSSDEETNIMMNRMRSFFKNMLVNASKGKPLEPTRKPTQIVYFEERLTRLMKSVPGINDQQVKEIVEYLSSEDTWSDSYDSSDYTDYTSSDLEGAPFFTESEDPVIPDMDVDVLEKLQKNNTPASSLGEMVEQDDFQKETAIMYQKLMNSVVKMQQSQEEQKKETEAKRSPPIAAKILHHISSRLVTLMHEVSGSDNSSTASISDSRQNLYLSSKDFRNPSSTSSPRTKSGSRRHRQLESSSSIDSNRSGEDKLNKSGEENNYTFNSLDSPKVLMGPNLGASPKSNPFKFTKNTSKSVEVLDLGRRRASLDDKSLKQSMAKSTSTDYDVWHGVHRDVDQRRGSLPRGQLDLVPSTSSGSGMADHDDERYSWKGSFESALASDSRTRLSIEAKRRSIGSDSNCEIFSSVEQMTGGSHQGSRASLIPSRSPSQSSKRSLKSSLPNSRSSLHISKSEKDITRNSEFSTTPTSELSTKLSAQDSDSDDNSGSISSSVRSSISSRYGRRSSVPETQVLARLSEDEDKPEKPARTTIPSNASGAVSVRQHSTNSLPRLGTSAIQKSKSTSSTMITSVAPSQPSNIATSTQGGVRSARYRPHGYKPPPSRKMSPASGGPGSRKSSAHSIGSFYDEGSEVSSKSGTPSPMVTRVPARVEAGSSALAREVREPSVCSRGSSGAGEGEMEEREVHGSQLIKASSMSSLGTRSESMASVYSQGEGRYGTVTVRGEVEFGFIYSFGSGSLDISIKQCRDLAPVDLKRNRSDPYVKVYLLPDRSKAGKRKTKVKKHTLNPVFEEILRFVMPLGEVERRTMWISVWHSDMFGRNDFLGEVMLPMSGQLFDDPSSQWFSLQDRTEPPEDESVTNSKGDIIVALKYVPGENSGARKSSRKKGTLMILIKEAKNLPVPKGTTLPDPYCKCYLLPAVPSRGKQKTGICRRTTSPRWEQTIVWEDLSMEEVMERSLELAIWDHDRIGKTQDFLGGARFNLGSGRHLGRSVAWMDGTGKEVSLWQQMLDRPNFWVEGCIGLRPSLDTRPQQ